jgi:hypothetical protein
MNVDCLLSENDETERELYQALPYGDDMARTERLRQSMLKRAFEGRLVGWEEGATT